MAQALDRASGPTPPASPADALRTVVSRFTGHPVVIVGDVMLDQFTVGRVQRLSPEAPVPVVEYLRDELRLGGAANVAHNVRALGGVPRLIGLVGRDTAAGHVREALAAAGISDAHLVEDAARPTTRKVRIVTTRHQQVARVDYESDVEASGHVEDALIAATAAAAADASLIVVSDYLKGAVTARLMQELRARREMTGITVLVDPKIPHLGYYAGATIVTPNHVEAEMATHLRIRSDDEARAAARAFRERAQCGSVLITRGEHGMWLTEGDRAGRDEPPHRTGIALEANFAAQAREVADVTGAGDTVIATLAMALASGATLSQAAELANHAAGVAVARFGPAAVTAAELASALP